MRPVHKRFHKKDLGVGSLLHHRHDLWVIHGHGLFAKDGLAGLERFDRPLGVLWVGRRDIDCIDVGIVDEVLVRPVSR